MSGDTSRGDFIQNLKAVIDELVVGAVKIDASNPEDFKKLTQTINLLKSKIINLDILENLDQVRVQDNRPKIERFCRERVAYTIATDKAVNAGCIANSIHDIMQKDDEDPHKKIVVEKLRVMNMLVDDLTKRRSTLKKLISNRIDMDLKYKEALLNYCAFLQGNRLQVDHPQDLKKKLQAKVDKTNCLRKLTTTLLLGPGCELNGKWINVLSRVRHVIDLNDLLS